MYSAVLLGREALPAELREGRGALPELEAHAPQNLRRLRELNVSVLDDLDEVAPRVAEVEPAPAQDLHAGLLEGAARRLLVVHHEAEVAMVVGRLRAAFAERDELVAHVQEGHARGAPAQLEVEDSSVEGKRLPEVTDLERHVVHADESRLRHVSNSYARGTAFPSNV